MTVSDFIQIVGAIVSGLVILHQILTLIRDWRGGTPEHRTIAKSLDRIQDEQLTLLRQILNKP